MTAALERLFAYMGGRGAYDELRRLSPETAAQLETDRTAEYDATDERDISQDNIFDVACYPDAYRAKEYVVRGWATDIRYALDHIGEEASE